MALWIPSCCCNNESSLRFVWGITAAANPPAADADLLLPRCLHTKRIPAGSPFSCFSLTGESTAADDKSLPLSVGFLKTLGLISFKYFCTTSFENRLVGAGTGGSHGSGGKMPPNLLVLLSLVSLEFRTLLSPPSCPVGGLFLAIDLCFLKMKTGNLGADLSSWIGDCGFEVGSIGRIFLLEMESEQRFIWSPNLVGIWGLCSGLWIFPAETEKNSISKNESSPSSSSSSSYLFFLFIQLKHNYICKFVVLYIWTWWYVCYTFMCSINYKTYTIWNYMHQWVKNCCLLEN